MPELEPRAPLPARLSAPPLMVVVPVYEFAPLRVSVPTPFTARARLLLLTPLPPSMPL